MAAALALNQQNYGTDPTAALTEHTYIQLGLTIQDDPTLHELALQGHGLNDPPAPRYDGYTNDFQNNVDNTTLFIGGGVDNQEKAIADFFDDVIITHTPFPVVVKNGKVVQLNQNGDPENSILDATTGLDDYMYGRVLTSADFSATGASTHPSKFVSYRKLVESSAINLSALPANGQIQSLLGSVSTTIAARGTTGGLTLHAWTADSSGQFYTLTDLAAEWQGYYQQVLNGQGWSLTPIQRLEANAEAAFENTNLSQYSPAYLALYRQDAQREFDAIDAAMQINKVKYGTDPNAPLTEQTYLQLETTIQSNPTLWELAVAGTRTEQPAGPALPRIHQRLPEQRRHDDGLCRRRAEQRPQRPDGFLRRQHHDARPVPHRLAERATRAAQPERQPREHAEPGGECHGRVDVLPLLR